MLSTIHMKDTGFCYTNHLGDLRALTSDGN